MQAIRTGFLTNALNPKAILYFMVLYPQFLEPAGSVELQFFEMGVISAVICLLWYILLANLMGKVRHIFSSCFFQKWLLRIMGGIFAGFGVRLALSD